MDFDYFYGRGADQFAFYQIPKILITDEKFAGITMGSKILYSLMLDRASLSAKNGWLDEDGKVFIYYKLDRIMADMHCANQKATKMLKEQEDKGGEEMSQMNLVVYGKNGKRLGGGAAQLKRIKDNGGWDEHHRQVIADWMSFYQGLSLRLVIVMLVSASRRKKINSKISVTSSIIC